MCTYWTGRFCMFFMIYSKQLNVNRNYGTSKFLCAPFECIHIVLGWTVSCVLSVCHHHQFVYFHMRNDSHANLFIQSAACLLFDVSLSLSLFVYFSWYIPRPIFCRCCCRRIVVRMTEHRHVVVECGSMFV